MKQFCDIGIWGLDWEENVGLVLSKVISLFTMSMSSLYCQMFAFHLYIVYLPIDNQMYITKQNLVR